MCFALRQSSDVTPQKFRVLNNNFDTTNRSVNVIVAQASTVTEETTDHDILISGNSGKDGSDPFGLFGVKGATLEDNKFIDYAGNAYVAYTAATDTCYGIKIVRNRFVRCGSTSQFGMVVFSLNHAVIEENEFTDCGDGNAGSYAIDLTTGSSSYLKIRRNKFSSPTSKTFVAMVKETGHTISDSTSTIERNVLLDGLTISGVTSSGALTGPDYYEVKAWTPVLGSDGGSQASNTFSKQWGRYTRIGNLVIAHFHIVMTAKDGGMSGGVQITGLPFTAYNDSGDGFYAGSISQYAGLDLSTGYTQVGVAAVRTLTAARLYQMGDNVAAGQLVPSALSPTVTLVGTIVYQTA